MALVGYEPHPAGGYVFRQDDGRTAHFFGPEAEGLKASIDARAPATTAAADAGIGFGPSENGVPASATPRADKFMPPPTASDAGIASFARGAAEASAAQDIRAALTPPTSHPTPAPAAPAPSPSSGAPATPAPAGAEPVATGPEAIPEGMTPGALYTMQSIQEGVRVGGRRAVDPVAIDAARAPVRTAQTVSGALPETAEEKARREGDWQALRDAQAAALAEIDAGAAERISQAEQRRTLALNEALAADTERRAKEQAYQNAVNTSRQTMALMQKESDAIAQQKVDPERLFKEKGVGGRILSAIAVGLGAFGASINGGPNFAMQIVEKEIDRDIEAQMDEIRRKGNAADNAIANFSKTYGLTLDEAREAFKASANRFAAARTDLLAQTNAGLEAKERAAIVRANFMQKNAEDWARMQEMHRGRLTTQSQFMDPQSASGGYTRALTPKEVRERADAGKAINDATGNDNSPDKAKSRLAQQSDELSRRVRLPDGSVAWATTSNRADTAQKRLVSGDQFKKNAQEQLRILNMSGDSLSPKLRGRYDALVQEQILLSKDSEDLGAIAKADQELVTPLAGVGGQDFLAFKNKTVGALESAIEHVSFRERTAREQLYKDPQASRHLTETEEEAGITTGRPPAHDSNISRGGKK